MAHGGRAVLGMNIRGRGERGQPVRERQPAVVSGGAAGCIAMALVVAIIEEGDGRGGKRGGQEQCLKIRLNLVVTVFSKIGTDHTKFDNVQTKISTAHPKFSKKIGFGHVRFFSQLKVSRAP
jgi:hypothetical protein